MHVGRSQGLGVGIEREGGQVKRPGLAKPFQVIDRNSDNNKKGLSMIMLKPLFYLAPRDGLEPPT